MIKNLLLYFRKYFFVLSTIFSYLLFFNCLFLEKSIIFSILYLMCFFVFLRYFLIELKNYGLKYFVLIIILASFLEMFLLGFNNIFYQFSLHIINLGIIFLFVGIDDRINNSKNISSFAVFFSGVRLFSLMLAIGYSLFFIGKYDQFNLTCEDLYKKLDNFVSFSAKPLSLSFSQVQEIKGNINNFYNTEVKEVVGISGIDSKINSNLQQKLSGFNLSSGAILSGEKRSLIENYLGKNKFEESKDSSKDNQKNFGDILKLNVFDNFIKDKETLDSKICEFLIQEIKVRYNDPSFKISVVIFMFILFWPFLRIVFFIISFFNLLFFKLLNILRVYKFQTVTDEVEEIV